MEEAEGTPKSKRFKGFKTPFKTSAINVDRSTLTSSPQHVECAATSTPDRSTCSLIPYKSEGKSSPVQSTSRLAIRTSKIKSRTPFKSPSIVSKTSNASESQESGSAALKEELRVLKLVAYHQKHNDLNELAELTEQWQAAAHRALHEIHLLIDLEPKPTMEELMKILHVDHCKELIKCECQDEEN